MDDRGSPDQEIADEQSRDDDCYSDHDDEETLDLDDLAPDDIRLFEEFRKLSQFFHELPKDMCIAQIMREFSSSESDLERVRYTYFDHLKQTCEDFPFGEDAELKKRMFTRSGDPLPVRLAQDIYAIIEVAEGGDPNVLKPMRRGLGNRQCCGPIRIPGQKAGHVVTVPPMSLC